MYFIFQEIVVSVHNSFLDVRHIFLNLICEKFYLHIQDPLLDILVVSKIKRQV